MTHLGPTTESLEPELPDLRTAYQARVKSGLARKRLALCGDPEAKRCATGRFLVVGDVLLVRDQVGGLVSASFVNADGMGREGWVRKDGIQRLSDDFGANSSWAGNWVSHDGRDPRFISVLQHERQRECAVKGDATFGQNGPWRVEHGGVNLGDFSGRFVVHGDQAKFIESEAADEAFNCKVAFRKMGLFLIVADNRQCGGRQVNFDGVYRKMAELRK